MSADQNQIQEFLRQYQADLASGQTRDLSEYLSLFPGDDIAITHAMNDLLNAQTVLAQDDDHTEVTRQERGGTVEGIVGSVLGHYRVLEEIGRGGQGMVFLARDERLGRQVALKVLNSMALQSEDCLQRFKREAEAVSRLDDPGICTVYDTGTFEGVPFIAMQFVEGKSLSETLKVEIAARCGDSSIASSESSATSKTAYSHNELRARVDRYVALIERVARSLHTAHENGLVHRDIKPGNIMLGKEGRPIILDFGLARDEDADGMGLTRTGDVLGTPAYMAPEQINGDVHRVDRRTDIYALGVTLFECITLERPFVAATRQALYRQILEGRATMASALVSGVRHDLDIILKTCMDLDMDRRYQSAEAMANDLSRFLRREPIQARPASWWLKLSRWAERNTALAIAVVVLFVLLVSGLAITTSLWRQSDKDRLRAERETKRADDKAQEASENLSHYEMLSDVNRYRQFEEEIAGFYPPHPDNVQRIDAWFAQVSELVRREPVYREELASLEANSRTMDIEGIERTHYDANVAYLIEMKKRRADLREALAGKLSDRARESYTRTRGAYSMMIGKLEERILSKVKYVFDDADQDWRYLNLERLMRYMVVLKDKETPLSPVASMLLLRDQCQRIREDSLVKSARLWQAAIKSIEDEKESPAYGGLKIEPQLGLVPLGQDPTTGLWEFADVLTGSIPERRASGRLNLAPDFAVVFVLVPGGMCTIGARAPREVGEEGDNIDPYCSGSELAVRTVRLAPFFMGKYEFTRSQWAIGTGDDVRQIPGKDGVTEPMYQEAGRHPLTHVSWSLANEFLVKLGFLLPTEAQWEYACRGGTSMPWWVGSQMTSLHGKANFGEKTKSGGTTWMDGIEETNPVDHFLPNGFGLYNVIGNVWELTRDAPRIDVEEFLPGDALHSIVLSEQFIIRGGSLRTEPTRGRSAARASIEKDNSSSSLGMRASRVLQGEWSRP